MSLYPLNLNSTTPAFFGSSVTINYELNRAVNEDEVIKIFLNVRSINGTVISSGIEAFQITPSTATFEINPTLLKVGQFYKLQLYWLDPNGESSPLSAVSVGKYTNNPIVTIQGLTDLNTDIIANENELEQLYKDLVTGQINSTATTTKAKIFQAYNSYQQNLKNSKNYMPDELIGSYSNEDKTEKVYSYCFNLYEGKGKSNLIETSGHLLHNSKEDKYSFITNLKVDKEYYVEYEIITINGLIKQSPLYRLFANNGDVPNLRAELVVENDLDEGSVNISFNPLDKSFLVNGEYRLLRADDSNDYSDWSTLYEFYIQGKVPSHIFYSDNTVQSGIKYIYAIQQVNSLGYSSGYLKSQPIIPCFNDMFLIDGERQLKIEFNPKVSSFKNTVFESKTDTIGNKYPFFFRNSNVKYKEFPLSGLISYHTDKGQRFFSKELPLIDDFNLTDENIGLEKEFKLEVLEWLQNGKPKLFKSPVEGNYIVTLLNVSLTPTDSLGRMLHTFNATAYESADNTYLNLIQYHLLKQKEKELVSSESVFTSTLSDLNRYTNIIPEDVVYCTDLVLKGISPETIISINTEDFGWVQTRVPANREYSYAGKFYQLSFITQGSLGIGTISYKYVNKKINPIFERVKTAKIHDTCLLQEVMSNNYNTHTLLSDIINNNMNLKELPSDAEMGKWSLNKIHSIALYQNSNFNRPTQIYYNYKDNEMYTNHLCITAANKVQGAYYYAYNINTYFQYVNDRFIVSYPPYSYVINGKVIDLFDKGDFYIAHEFDLEDILIGPGLVANYTARLVEKFYDFEAEILLAQTIENKYWVSSNNFYLNNSNSALNDFALFYSDYNKNIYATLEG